MSKSRSILFLVAALSVAALGVGSAAVAANPPDSPPVYLAQGFRFAWFTPQPGGQVVISGQHPSKWVQSASKWVDLRAMGREFSVDLNTTGLYC